VNTILGLDLGKFKSVACLYNPQTTDARFTTVFTHPADLRPLLEVSLLKVQRTPIVSTDGAEFMPWGIILPVACDIAVSRVDDHAAIRGLTP
jgi:hypothetical protein